MLRLLILLLVGLAAHAWLLWEFFSEAWKSPTFAFFPFGVAVAAWLLVSRRDDFLNPGPSTKSSKRVDASSSPPSTSLLGITGIAVLVSLVSHLLHWPHLGWCSFLLWLWLVTRSTFGRSGGFAIAPVIALLYFLKPLPDFLEPWIQLGLQHMVNSLTSIQLDFLRVFHYFEGNVIGLVSQDESAVGLTSGVSSLYLAMFLCIAWGIHFRYHAARTVLLTSTAVFWVVVVQAVRLFVLLRIQDQSGESISDSAHLWSYWLAFGALLFLIWSTDQLIASFWWQPESESESMPKKTAATSEASLQVPWGTWDTVAVVALVVIAGVSIRLLPLYRAEPSTLAKQLAEWRMNEDNSAEPEWKMSELPSQTLAGWDSRSREAPRWQLEREGKSYEVCIPSASITYPGPLWIWEWHGWTMERIDAQSRGDRDRSQDLIGYQGNRFPAEIVTVLELKQNTSGVPWTMSDPWMEWSHAADKTSNAVQYALGLRTLEQARKHSLHRPVQAVTLVHRSVRPLEEEALQQVLSDFGDIAEKLTGNPAVDGVGD